MELVDCGPTVDAVSIALGRHTSLLSTQMHFVRLSLSLSVVK